MKKIINLLMCVMLVCLLAGCSKEEHRTNKPAYDVGGSNVNIYFPRGNEIVCDDEQYQLKQPDSVAASVEEIMGVISGKLSRGLSYHTYMLDEQSNLALEFVVNEGALATEYELLAKASVAKTLFQLNDIGSIQINITNAESGEVSSNLYTNQSFYFYGYDTKSGLNTVKCKIYRVSDDGTCLNKKWVEINPEPYISVEESIVNELEAMEMIPKGTTVKSLSINSDVCYITLSSEFANPISNIGSELVVYSIVNSLTSLDKINSVVLSIDGNSSGMYRGKLDISVPLKFNEDLIGKK